jgi:hypothetical protein
MEDVIGWLGDFFDSLNDNSGAVQAIATVFLVAVTFVYVLLTAKQAKASAKMAEEMREQRMALDRPNLLLRFDDTFPPSVVRIRGQSSEDDLAEFPEGVSFGVYNDGPGPAKRLEAVFDRPGRRFQRDRCGFLVAKESWDCELSVAPFAEPETEGRQSVADGKTAIIVSYCDIHNRRWETRLDLGEVKDWTGSQEDPGEYNLYLEPGEQQTFGPYPPEAQQ